jgi:hypothetical protein
MGVAAEDVYMSTTNSQIAADLEAVCKSLAEHKPVDPEVLRRVHERRRTSDRPRFDRSVSLELLREAREE